MINIYKRILLFSFLCIPTRFCFMYMSQIVPTKYNKYFVLIALLFSISQFYLYLSDSRKIGAFGGDVWWNRLRPVHGILYLLFCIYTYKQDNNAYIPLLIDIVVAIVSFVLHYNGGLNMFRN